MQTRRGYCNHTYSAIQELKKLKKKNQRQKILSERGKGAQYAAPLVPPSPTHMHFLNSKVLEIVQIRATVFFRTKGAR